MKSLPPLNSLRAFEAAARHSSFTAAAHELHVTHGAVSRQIQQLETFLGRSLFRRLPRGIRLTQEGRDFAYGIRRAFGEISDAVESVRILPSSHNALTLSALPGLASRWLIPRLHRFKRAHPGWEIHVSTTVDMVDFARDPVDLAIRYGMGSWPGLKALHLFELDEFPVCAPALLNGDPPLTSPADLQHFTLLHFVRRRYWVSWLKFAGIDNVDPQEGWVLDDANALLQAAIEGEGVALTSLPLAQADLAAGRLVKPFDIELHRDVAYYAVCPIETFETPKVNAAMKWLVEEAERTRLREPVPSLRASSKH